MYLVPFLHLFADIAPLIQVRETFGNGQEPRQQKQQSEHAVKYQKCGPHDKYNSTHLRRRRRPLSPRWDKAGFSWISA